MEAHAVRQRGGQLRSAKFLFTPLATPLSARSGGMPRLLSATVARCRCRQSRRGGGWRSE